MTFHIVTIFSTGTRLSCERGFLVCKLPDGNENRIALADIRGLVIANPATSFTNICLARLLARDAVILHCDEQFKPIGWTVPLDRVIRREVFFNQIKMSDTWRKALWKAVVGTKMKNQAALLDSLGIQHSLYELIDRPLANEANVAKQFWGHYFNAVGEKQKRERRGAETFENKALNYGYAVLSTLVHRAVLIYGLQPSLGIHHEARYRSYPLVYDLMEPFRSFIDLLFSEWTQQKALNIELSGEEAQFQAWICFLMNSFRECRIKHLEDKHSYKLMDAVDRLVRSVATVLSQAEDADPALLWLPRLSSHYWLTSTDEVTEDDDEKSSISA
jgi:CRISPR-associated protein Cas1